MKLKLAIHNKLFFSHFFAVLLVSGSIGTYFYLSAVDSLIDNLRDRLKYSAAIISETIDAAELEEIRDKSDTATGTYQKYLELLRKFRSTNPDIAYLYIMRREEEKIVFIIDSDEGQEQAVPGEEYTQEVPSLVQGFSRPSVDTKIYTDRWGSFMSGYSPVRHGQGRYLVGMDMRADEVQNKLYRLRISGIISLIFSTLLAFLFSRLLSRHFTKPIRMLVSYCSSIGKGRFGERLELKTGDELDDLIDAYNEMSENLGESHDKRVQAEEALKRAKGELEERVEARTKELVGLTEKLVQEIAERRQVEERLSRVATSDSLTGLINRRAMLEHLRYQMFRNTRNGIPFVILMIDIDHFKTINDTYGHDVGDHALIAAAEYLVSQTRNQDLVARWGGEEFLVLLPDTYMNGGRIVAEKIRSGIAEETFQTDGHLIQLTLSIGIAEYRSEQPIDQCIKNADAALYEAKKSGRNRVVMSQNGTEVAPEADSETGTRHEPE